MQVVLNQFTKALAESRLMTTSEVSAFIETLPPDKKPDDGAALARELVRQKKLTKFQAQAIYQGKTKGLIMGDYVVLDRIGQGGMGQVYKAQHKVMKRLVALKTLPAAATKSDRAVKRFHREVTVAARLSHPNIVTAHDAREDHGVHYLVMEYVDGTDLAHLLRKQGRVPLKTALDYILQAAKALEYAHGKGVIHRDIKPSNLVLDHEGTIKILDMGLARLNEMIGPDDSTGSETLTGTGEALGTIDYMPPEQAENTKMVDARADVYSLGCTLYSLLVGRPIYSGDTTVVKLLAHRETAIPSLRAERPDVPQKLDAVFQKMVAKRPDDRYRSMTEVIAELEDFTGPTPEQFSDTTQFAGGAPQVATLPEEARDESLPLDFPVVSPIDNFLRAHPKPDRKQQILVGGVIAAAFLVVLLFAIVLSVRTPDGTLVVEINEPDAVVTVFDEKGKIEITRKSETGSLSISVDPGRHRLKVEKAGFRFFTTDFAIESGGKKVIAARLERLRQRRAVGPRPSKPEEPRNVAAKSMEPPELVQRLEAAGQVTSVAFSPDGALLAQGGDSVQIWETGTWRNHQLLKRDAGRGGHVDFSADGSLLAVEEKDEGSDNSHIVLWDIATGEPRTRIKTGYTRYVRSFTFSPNGAVLASTGDDRFAIELWDVSTGELRKALPLGKTMTSIGFGPKGSILAAGVNWGVELWDVNAGTHSTLQGDPELLSKYVRHLSFSPNATTLVTVQGPPDGYQVRLWDLKSQELRHRLDRRGTSAWSLTYSPDGSLVAAGYDDGSVTLWKPTTGEELVTFPGHTAKVASVAFTPDGRLLATGSHDATVKIWDVSKFLKPTSTFPPLAIAPFDEAQAKQHQQRWAKHLGVPVERENSIGMKMVLIPPGEFLMGSSEEDQARFLAEAKAANDQFAVNTIPHEGPQHRVRITRPFYLGKYEMTQAQWEAVMGSNPSHAASPTRPVNRVSWDDSQALLAKLNEQDAKERMKFAVPTEAEWEYACRAGTTTAWHCGDSEVALQEYASLGPAGTPQPVGQLKPNAWGLHDMHGCASEWCADTTSPSNDYYAESPLEDPSGAPGGWARVHRGGSYRSAPREARSAHRLFVRPDGVNNAVGVRLAQTIRVGRLILNISEPNATVSIDNGQSTFTTPDDAQPIESLLIEGKHTIEVSKPGFKTVTKELTLVADGREASEVRLERMEGAGAVDPDREVAEWLLSVGGQFNYWDKKSIGVRTLNDLPKGPFHIVHVYLDGKRQIDDADLDRLADLKQLSQVQLHGNRKITDEGLKRLATIGSLDALYLGGTRITDDGLRYLKQLPKLKVLHLSGSPITDAGIAHLRGMDRLQRLMLVNTKVTDSGLEHLKELPGLTELDLTGTKVTPAGVADLQAAIPNCKIIWDGADSPAEE